jgi:hypothetical protein
MFALRNHSLPTTKHPFQIYFFQLQSGSVLETAVAEENVIVIGTLNDNYSTCFISRHILTRVFVTKK